MKQQMSLRERTFLIAILVSLLIGIGIGMSIKILGVDAETTETETETTETESETEAQIVKRKAEICRKSTENTIILLETETTPASIEPKSEESGSEAPTETTEAPILVESTVGETKAAAPPVVTTTAASATPLFTVDGALLDPQLQEYAYNTLCALGIGWYFPTFLCQMYQESRFNQAAVSAHGDYGLCQLKGIYHTYFCDLAGIHGADLINDPFANIHVGAFLMAYYFNQCNDVNTAISAYYTGSVNEYSADYVAQVRQWETTLQRK